MRRWALVLAGPVVALAAFASPAAAANHTTVTETDHVHGAFTEPEFNVNPCSGAAITSFAADGNVVEHITYFLEDGQMTEVWATFTETGKVAITDAAGVSYSGHFTVWGNFNLNERNSNNTFTLTVKLAGSDGSVIDAHETQHFALNANGVVTVDFDKMSLTCG
jgi:hypothetical protein